MKAPRAPQIETRTAAQFATDVRDKLGTVCPHPGSPGAALIAVFAHFCEITGERLNGALDKNRLAFLELLGASQLPPQPARVLLTFSLTAQSIADVVVPSGTQVGAAPAKGEKEPVIFETEHDVVVTAARLVRIGVREPERDAFTLADPSRLVAPVPLFRGLEPIEHMFAIRNDSIVTRSVPMKIKVNFVFPQSKTENLDPRSLQWEFWDGKNATILVPNADTTNGLTQNGSVEFEFDSLETNVPASAGWLRCRLLTPIVRSDSRVEGMIRENQLPIVQNVMLEGHLKSQEVSVVSAFTNRQILDHSKKFFPFGTEPNPEDTFYLALDSPLPAAAKVTLKITLAEPGVPGVGSPILPTETPPKPVLQWEFWDGLTWRLLNGSEHDNRTEFDDTTKSLSIRGEVSFVLPVAAVPTRVNGVDGCWIRISLVSGTALAPPCIQSIVVRYSLDLEKPPQELMSWNDFQVEDLSPLLTDSAREISVFKPTADTRPAIYFGFDSRASKDTYSFVGKELNLYLHTRPVAPEAKSYRPRRVPELRWEWWTDDGWREIGVQNDMNSLTRPALVSFPVPYTIAIRGDFGTSCYWLRVVWEAGQYDNFLELDTVLLNTVRAAQTITVRNEILGSSNGTPNQRFRVTRVPILSGTELEVQERSGVWKRWEEVADFYASRASDRHYVLNHLTGEVQFGNGTQGLIPPTGAENIRIAIYRTGGGATGNRPANTITELKTSLPYVEGVMNPEASVGGADAESTAMLSDRIPRVLRHRDRAVTQQDYEDLALLASPEVALAKCIQATQGAGVLNVIIVPRNSDPQPMPSLELTDRVRLFLGRRCSPAVDLIVSPPKYCSVDVTAEVAVSSIDGAYKVGETVQAEFERFLNPVRGGLDGMGWEFGRYPQRSDFYALIESIPGVDHVRRLTIRVPKTEGLFLVCSGTHQVRVSVNHVGDARKESV